MNLLILDESDRISENSFRVSGNRQDHIIRVLKLGTNDQIRAGIVNGSIGSAKIERSDKTSITLNFVADENQLPDPIPCVDIICALPRPQTVRKVLNLAGTWGVRKLDFIRANRVEKSYYHSPLLQPDKMRPYLLEGLSQGKQTRLSLVSVHERFKPYFEDVFIPNDSADSESSLKLLPHPEAESNLSQVFQSTNRRIVVAIGPEGGWVDFEIEFMMELGFSCFRLARPVLRVESAAIAALSQIELLSDFDKFCSERN